MPTFRKAGKNIRVEIARKGIRKSATFPTKGAAVAWAGREESAIIDGSRGQIPDKTFGQLLERYANEVAPGRKGERWELVRIGTLRRDRIAQVKLKKLDASHIADWRDRRLKAVSASSVRREWNLMSAACTIAIKEWRWLRGNPFRDAKRPTEAKHRTRTATNEERKKLHEAATTPRQRRVLDAFLFAEECGMRAGEICKASVSGTVATLFDTKNGTARMVPLSKRAIELYGDGFSLSSAGIDAAWRGLTAAAGIEDLHFHDSRREAITRLSKKLDIYELARTVGHKNLNQLLTYYSISAEDLAKKL